MKKQIMGLASLAIVAAGSSVPMAASADILGVEGLSANVALQSDYYFRGFSQNQHDAALQGGVDYAHSSGLYVGAWASSVDRNFFAGASNELDVYVGWAGDLGPVGVDVGVLRYIYPSTTFGDNNTTEWHIGVSHDFGPVAAGLTYYKSSDFFGLKDADYVDFGIEVPINDNWSAHAHYGVTSFDKSVANGGGDDYKDSSIGVATSVGPFGVDLTATNTSGIAGGCGNGSLCESQFIVTISLDL